MPILIGSLNNAVLDKYVFLPWFSPKYPKKWSFLVQKEVLLGQKRVFLGVFGVFCSKLSKLSIILLILIISFLMLTALIVHKRPKNGLKRALLKC